LVFGALGLIPTNRAVRVITEGPSWNYTSGLNLVFLVVAAALVVRFLRTGGPAMLRMMSMSPQQMEGGDHEQGTPIGHGGHHGHPE
jgi:hypothetical protein